MRTASRIVFARGHGGRPHSQDVDRGEAARSPAAYHALHPASVAGLADLGYFPHAIRVT